jgi:hypothetical protein
MPRLNTGKYSFVFLVCIAAYLLSLDQSVAQTSVSVQPFVASCAQDDEISPGDRSTINQAAIQFIQTAISNPATAYSSFTESAKETTSIDAFTSMIQGNLQPSGNFSTPEAWVAMTAKPGEDQAYVIVEGQTRNYTWDFVVWLGEENGSWHVHYFQFTIVAIAGKNVEELWTTARTEENRHHNFNAWVLYSRVLQMAGRGPHFQLGIYPEIKKEMTNLEVPLETQGQPPFNWQYGKSSFKVLNAAPVGVEGKLYLNITQEIANWADDKDADRMNRELITAFKVAHPECTEVFAGLLVAARERGGPRIFRTVDANLESAK